jgi:hypothetical protein
LERKAEELQGTRVDSFDFSRFKYKKQFTETAKQIL